MSLRKHIDWVVGRLASKYGVPKPKWRFAGVNEELQEWYDPETRTLILGPDTDLNISGIRHEFLHYYCDVRCKKFPGEFVYYTNEAGEPCVGNCTEDLADQYMWDPIEE